MTEAQLDKFLKAHPPIGHLAQRHPVFAFGVVVQTAAGYQAVFMGKVSDPLLKGTLVRLWNREEIVV